MSRFEKVIYCSNKKRADSTNSEILYPSRLKHLCESTCKLRNVEVF